MIGFPNDPGGQLPTKKARKTGKMPTTQPEDMDTFQVNPQSNNYSQVQSSSSGAADAGDPNPNGNDRNGILRYFSVVNSNKRKRDNKNVANNKQNFAIPTKNRFGSLANENDIEPKKSKPPPIYVRDRSTNIANSIKQIAKKEYYLVDLKKGALNETKIQVTDETDYTTITQWLDNQQKEYYSFQMKSEKGIRIVIKGIDHTVSTDDIKKDLEEQGFSPNWVHNILNRYKQPQPMFKVELKLDNKLQKGQPHPIYDVKYILNRKIKIEEPYKRKGPVQCLNCQEFGHTRRYCKLKTACVICGANHNSENCEMKEKPNAKCCSNCGQPHTANYRGCPVYTAINRKSNQQTQNVTPNQNPNHNPAINKPALLTSPNNCPPTSQNNSNTPTYANVLKSNPNVQYSQNNNYTENNPNDNLIQMMMMLMNSIQQMTSSMQQMQELQRQQMAILTKIIKP